jgi:hypothetical protein
MKKFIFIYTLLLISFTNFAQKDKTYNSLEEALKNPNNVYRLNLDWKKLGKIDNSIEKLQNLTYLKISSNNLTNFPDAVCNLKNLKELDISWNKITEIPDCISNLSNLEILTANSNKITSLPESIGDLSKLQKLKLSFNQITRIPKEIENLTNLEELDLNSNKLKTLPVSISKLENLKYLDIGFNQFDSIPVEITKMTNLRNIGEIKTKYEELKQEAEYKKNIENEQKQIKEETANFDYILNFETKDFYNEKTGDFINKETEYTKLPWDVKNIYNFLKTKKDIIYTFEKFSLEENKVKGSIDLGYKIKVYNNKKLESKLYNYTQKEYIEHGGLLKDMKNIINLDSITQEMKFMPFPYLTAFKVLNKPEEIKIKGKTYSCTVIEGIFMFDKIKYWMVTDKPGLIVKVITESTYYRKTWTLKKIK